MILFRDIPGRENLKEKLTADIIEGKPGHAYIFEGPAGCGKRKFAEAFAYMLLCLSEGEKPCGSCRHCQIIKAGGTGELYLIDEPGNSISVDSVRQLQENISLMPVSSKGKVYVIADGDRMTRQAQNCLLKTLEEPPPYAFIIITASNEDKFIDTIRSRAVTLRIGINSVEEIEEFLKRKYGNPVLEISIAAQCSMGSIGRAEEILESKDFTRHRDLAVDFIKNIIDKQYPAAYETAGKLSKSDTAVFFATSSSILRDMIVYSAAGGRLNNIDKKDIIIKGASRYSENVLVRIAFIMEQTAVNITANASKRQSLDAMIVKITEELAKW